MSAKNGDTVVEPLLPVAFLQDYFSGIGAEVLQTSLADGGSGENLETLFRTICFFNDARRLMDELGDVIPEGTNDMSVDMLVEGWTSLRELGCIK